jgi:hypothetical protein
VKKKTASYIDPTNDDYAIGDFEEEEQKVSAYKKQQTELTEKGLKKFETGLRPTMSSINFGTFRVLSSAHETSEYITGEVGLLAFTQLLSWIAVLQSVDLLLNKDLFQGVPTQGSFLSLYGDKINPMPENLKKLYETRRLQEDWDDVKERYPIMQSSHLPGMEEKEGLKQTANRKKGRRDVGYLYHPPPNDYLQDLKDAALEEGVQQAKEAIATKK